MPYHKNPNILGDDNYMSFDESFPVSLVNLFLTSVLGEMLGMVEVDYYS